MADATIGQPKSLLFQPAQPEMSALWTSLDEHERRIIDFGALLGPEAVPISWLRSLTGRGDAESSRLRIAGNDPVAEAIENLVDRDVLRKRAAGEKQNDVGLREDWRAWRLQHVLQSAGALATYWNAIALLAIRRARNIKLSPTTMQNWDEAAFLLSLAKKLAAAGRCVTALELAAAVSEALEIAGAGKAAEETLTELVASVPEDEWTIKMFAPLTSLGKLQIDRAAYKEALSSFERAESIVRRFCGPTHELKAVVQYNLASALSAMGKLDLAETAAWQSVSIFRQKYEENHVRLVRPYGELAMIAQKRGDRTKAIEWCDRIIEVCKRHGRSERALAEAYLGLATIHFEAKDLAAAREAAERAVEVREQVLGQGHPELATFYSLLAIVLKGMGRFDEARRLFEKVLTIRSERLGEAHEQTLGTRGCLAKTLEAQNDFVSAQKQWETIVAIRSCLQNDSLLAGAANNLAIALFRQKKHEQALGWILRAIELGENLRSSSRELATRYQNAVAILREMNRIDEAIAFANKCLAVHRSLRPLDTMRIQGAQSLVKALEKMPRLVMLGPDQLSSVRAPAIPKVEE